MKSEWTKKRIVIILHEGTHGPGHDLRDFLLKRKVSRLLFIAHPLLFFPENALKPSRYELYTDGKLIKEGVAFLWKFPEPLLYVKDFIYSIFWSIKFNPKSDISIGLGNLNALSGLLLKFFGLSQKVVYYVIDYVPNRFESLLLNNLYHFMERLSAEKCDASWNLSPRMIRAREKKWRRKFPNQSVVPHGVYIKRTKKANARNKKTREIIYMGYILEKQGIQLVIESLPAIIEHLPRVKFVIIGKGPYEKSLKKLVKKLKIEKYVEFAGYIQSHQRMENRIAQACLAVALYNRKLDPYDFTYYADPGKVKNYLGAGVPVLITDVPFVARQIKKANCGFIVDYDKKDLTRVLLSYFSNKRLRETYSKNALSFAKRYEWSGVFSKALSRV